MQKNKKEKKFVSAVVYLHNDQNRVRDFLDKIIPLFEDNFQQYEIVCVDDGCTDTTVGVLKEYLAEKEYSAMVNVVHMSFFHGLESAMNAGRDLAIGDFIYEFDSVDMDYEPQLIMDVYKKLLEGNDIVVAGTGKTGRLSSGIFYTLYNWTSRGRGKIGPETFRIISRRAVNRVKSIGQYIPYRKAVYSNCGLNKANVTYTPMDTVKNRGRRKNIGERTSLALDSFIYFTNGLERLSAILCAAFLLITIAVGAYIVRDYFSGNAVVEGWMSTMGFLALGFFGVFALLTIILKYLSVILNLIFRQQRYLVADIEKVVKR